MTEANPNPQTEIIARRIEQDGPISIADYMLACLAHPQYGYYTSGLPVGGRGSADRTGGDFITAPEVSQMFGELIGVWCMEVWVALGKPDPFTLAEFGPGRGTLMKDLLRAARAMPDFLSAARVVLVEISPTLAEQQALTLSDHGGMITWAGSIDGLPERPTIAVGNEFLDALPFHQWVKTVDGWMERGIGLRDGKLAYVLLPNVLKGEAPAGKAGDIFETAPARTGFVETLAGLVLRNNGAALMVDYGHLKTGIGDTFQALRDHTFADPLQDPGKADLTSHVDFQALLDSVQMLGCLAPEPVTQGEFLLNLGLLERAGALGAGREKFIQETLRHAVERLAAPTAMGDLFKVAAFGAPATLGNRWPGFV